MVITLLRLPFGNVWELDWVYIMDIMAWFQLAVICFLGAMSPGPSLALVIGNTIAGGRMYGIVTSVGHAVGIGWWAILTAIGVGEVLAHQSGLLVTLQSLGACLLAYIGFRTILASHIMPEKTGVALELRSGMLVKGVGEGLLISLLNPKIALFFLAIFSHFVHSDGTLIQTGLMGAIAGVIDALWYISVVIIMSRVALTKVLRNRMTSLHRVSGSLLIIIALYLIGEIVLGLV